MAPPSYGTTFRLDTAFSAVFERQGAGITALAVAPSGDSYVTGTFTTLDGQRRDGFARLSGSSTLDAGFNPAVSGTVTGVLPQGSEWVVIGGSFTEVNGQARRGLARLSADGLTVDPAFMPELVCNGTRGRIVQQPDGKLLVVGDFVGYAHGNLVRLNTDGTLDPTWAPTGQGAQWPNSLVVQSDGKIVVAVTHYDGNAVPGIARLNADGNLDTSFAVGAGFNSEVKALALQPDGKILVVGGFTTYDGTPCVNLARLNTDGTLDPSLSAGSGFVPNVSADALLLQPDGRIVLGGSFSTYNGTACGALIRIDSTGLLEPIFAAGALPAAGVRALGYDAANGQLVVAGTFTTVGASATSGLARYELDGTVVNALAGGERVEAMVLAAVPVAGGDWVVAGDFTLVNGVAQNRIARLNSDGSLDSGFAVGSGFDKAVSALARTGDGKILAGGAFTNFNGTDCSGLARVAADGSFDAGFVIGAGFNSPNGHNIGYLTVMGDGRVVVAGEFTAYDGEPARYIIRLQSDGARDVSFSNWAPDLFIPQGLAVEADGRILSGSWVLAMNGWTFSRQGGARLLANGSLDPSFDPTTNGVGVGPWAFALQPDGKFIVAGFQSAASPLRLGVARFNNDGSFDPTYGSATMMIGTPTSINLQPDGRLLAAGYLNYGGSPRSAGRYLADGTQDPTFVTFDGDTGPFAGNGNSGACYTDDGRILVPGVTGRRGATRQIGLALLRPEVVPAPVIATQPAAWQTAVVGGTTILSVEATSPVPLNYQWRKQGVAIPGATGKRFTLPSATMADAGAYDVLVSDGVTSVASQTVTFAVEPPSYGTTFRLDKSFAPLFEQSGASVNVLGLVGDGSCYIAGGFSTLAGQRRSGVARLGVDGLLDLGFAPSFNAPIAAMISLGGDGVLVGGRFSEVNGAACSGLVRLSADGATVDASFGAELGFGTVSRMLRQEDGKILVQGVFDGYTKGTLARLNADGTLDATWQPGAAGLSETESLALQPDGKILVGTCSSGASLPSRIVRLNGDGSVDPTFVYNPATLENLTGLSLQSDGRVLVAGPYTAGSTDKRAKIVRLNGDGTVDGSFSTGAGFQDYDAISAVVPLPDGTILVGGRFTALNGTACACVVRLTATGALVEPQGADWPRSPVRALAYDAARSQVVLAGDFTALGATASSGFARFALDETLVATNAAGGRFGGYVSATVPVAGGDWVVGGSFTHVNGVPQGGIARLHADGSVDASFAPGGFDGPVYAAVRTGDGKLVVGGAFSQLAAGAGCNRIARLYADGSFDPTFESGAGITGNRVSHLVAMRDGRIVAAGDFASYDGVSAPYIVRLLDSGRLDTSFARVLNAITPLGLGVDDLGRVYEGAWWTSANGWSFSRLGGARLNADGQLDSSWNLAGSGGPITYPTAFAFQPDGKIIVAGFWGLARFGSDGAWDRSYAAGTHANISSGLTLLPDGRVLASAGYTEDSERSRNVVRFGTTGRFDSTFGAFDYAFPVIPKEEWCGNGARYTDDGRILVPNVNACREGQWQYGLVMLKPDEDPRPAITASPTSQTVAPGAPATFAVTATGDHLRYQWFKDGVALAGQNQSVLILPAVAPADFGAYIARVENDAGSATSQAAVLAVEVAGGASYRLLNYYHPLAVGNTWLYENPADGASRTRLDIDAVRLITTYSGQVTPTPASFTAMPVRSTHGAYAGGVFSAEETWDDFFTVAADRLHFWGNDEDAGTRQTRAGAGLGFPATLTVGGSAAMEADLYSNGVWYGRVASGIRLLGVETVTVPAGTFAGCLHLQIVFARPDGVQSNEEWWAPGVGTVKRLGVEDSWDDRQLLSFTAAAPVQFVAPPAGASIENGATTTLAVTATGPGPVTYQWYQGDSGDIAAPVVGATEASFTSPPLNAWARYWVRASSMAGTTDSDTLLVKVADAPMKVADWAAQPEVPVAQRAPEDTPAGDGVSNLMKFALGVPPMESAEAELPKAEMIPEAGGKVAMALDFAVNPQAQGIRYALEVTDDCVTWTEVAFLIEEGGTNADGTQLVRLREAAPSVASRKFVRLKVEVVP